MVQNPIRTVLIAAGQKEETKALKEAADKAGTYLEKVASPLKAKGIKVRCNTAVGEPTHDILRKAHKEDVDLIVMSTHYEGELHKLVTGSIAEKVLLRTKRPVLLVKPEKVQSRTTWMSRRRSDVKHPHHPGSACPGNSGVFRFLPCHPGSFLRRKPIPKKQVAAGTFHTGKRSPQGMLRSEPLPRDESGTLDGPVPSGNLRSERQKKLIQAFPGEKISHQSRTPFDKDDLAGKDTADRGKDFPRADRVTLLHLPDDDGCGKPAFANPVGSPRGRNDQHVHRPGPEDGKIQVDLTPRSDDDVQRGGLLP